MSIQSQLQLAIVVPTKSRSDEISGLLENLSPHADEFIKLIVVDSSPDESTKKACLLSELHQRGKVEHIRAGSGAGYQRNIGISYASKCGARYVCLLDDDIRIGTNFLTEGMRILESSIVPTVVGGWDKECPPTPHSSLRFVLGFSGPKQGFCVSRAGHATYGSGRLPGLQEVEWLPGGMIIGSVQALRDHPFQEQFRIYGGDLDVCLRLSASGYSLVTSPDLGVTHLSASGGKESRWRHYLGYFRARYWFAGQDYAPVSKAAVIANGLVSIFANVIYLAFGKRGRLSWAFGDLVGVIEALLGRSRPTPRSG